MGSGLRTFVAEDLWLLVGIVTFALAGLVAVAGFGTLSSAIAVVGWFAVAPIFLFWGEEIADLAFDADEPDDRGSATGGDALERLKRRYADGEIDEAEFERRLDRLLGADDALERVARSGSGGRDEGGSLERERDRERERERERG